MAVVARKRQHGVTYYVTFFWNDKKQWERAGSDRREAKRLNKRRLEEVEAGTYRPRNLTRRPTVAEFAAEWLPRRANRTAAGDAVWLRDYVLNREWFAGLRVEDAQPRHIIQLVTELKTAWSKRFKRTISGHSVSNIYGVVSVMFRDAFIEGLVKANPCVLPDGLIQRRTKKPRAPYSLDSIAQLLRCPDVHPTARVFSALALLTGMREGEVCGRRWKDWDRGSSPLGCLTVDCQYDGQPLKGDRDEIGEVARKVPVHPELARVLEWWQSQGFALVHRCHPSPESYIVPNKDGECYGRSAAYALFQRALGKAGVANLSLHATRHTFLTLCRRGGARKEVIERVTHNASGDTVDQYTHWDWGPLCEAVMCFGISSSGGDGGGDVGTNGSRLLVAPPGLEPRPPDGTARNYSDAPPLSLEGEFADSSRNRALVAAEGAARQQDFKSRAGSHPKHAWDGGDDPCEERRAAEQSAVAKGRHGDASASRVAPAFAAFADLRAERRLSLDDPATLAAMDDRVLGSIARAVSVQMWRPRTTARERAFRAQAWLHLTRAA
jgi:integrase